MAGCAQGDEIPLVFVSAVTHELLVVDLECDAVLVGVAPAKPATPLVAFEDLVPDLDRASYTWRSEVERLQPVGPGRERRVVDIGDNAPPLLLKLTQPPGV